ncbi:MAG TPA: M20/M25/M40 family metallo-hydrolase [Candidatus Aminicenantes bacterium]|nr:M20/M25/M40 family metallo-hydrolase [Candidatus Aminicenantes bacterium]
MRKNLLPAAVLAALALAAPGAETPGAGDPAAALAELSGVAAYEYCKTLAADPFAGRFTGTAEYGAAARWAAGKFQEWGLAAPPGGFLQPFPAPHSLVDRAKMTVAVAGKERELEAGKDFLPMLFSDSGSVSAPAVFVGWGISAPELGYDDYAGVDARGKFVVCFRGVPRPDDKRFQRHDEHRVRMQAAQRKGAVGLIYVYPEVQANPNGDRLERFFPAEISEAAADSFLEPRSVKAADLKKDLLAYRVPISFPLDVRIGLEVEARHFPAAEGYNIVGCLPGSDPALASECIVLGAHFDGCGRHLGILFPGADDNASGSAVVMEIARALAASGLRLRRPVVFVLFGGEEMGLLGANHFASHLSPPFRRVDAMFNLDMEGEGDRAFASFSAEPDALRRAIERADARLGILSGSREIREVGVRSSDFAPFFLQGVPCAGFFSNGPHLAYHQAGDSILRINPDILAAIARLTLLSAWHWDSRP